VRRKRNNENKKKDLKTKRCVKIKIIKEKKSAIDMQAKRTQENVRSRTKRKKKMQVKGKRNSEREKNE
jgi:hypothetical protein